ncbi:Tumor necrosis factor ligand superfamily member 4 [Aix galericulata]|nr:Tumor necrosis factor ligand superfamily member 4 [Aix galericulata]
MRGAGELGDIGCSCCVTGLCHVVLEMNTRVHYRLDLSAFGNSEVTVQEQAVLAGSVAAMDGQPDAELRKQDDQMDCEREPAGMSGDEWKSWKRGQVRRNTLHLVSAAAQWILLLACLVYLGLDSLQLSTPPSDKVLWTYIRYTGESIKGVAMNFSDELGSIHTRNGSIMITCDGPYLVSLNAKLSSDLDDNSSLKLMMRKTENKTVEPFWEQTIQGSSSTRRLQRELLKCKAWSWQLLESLRLRRDGALCFPDSWGPPDLCLKGLSTRPITQHTVISQYKKPPDQSYVVSSSTHPLQEKICFCVQEQDLTASQLAAITRATSWSDARFLLSRGRAAASIPCQGLMAHVPHPAGCADCTVADAARAFSCLVPGSSRDCCCWQGQLDLLPLKCQLVVATARHGRVYLGSTVELGSVLHEIILPGAGWAAGICQQPARFSELSDDISLSQEELEESLEQGQAMFSKHMREPGIEARLSKDKKKTKSN